VTIGGIFSYGFKEKNLEKSIIFYVTHPNILHTTGYLNVMLFLFALKLGSFRSYLIFILFVFIICTKSVDNTRKLYKYLKITTWIGSYFNFDQK